MNRILILMLVLVAMTARAQNDYGEWAETDYSEYEITHEFFTPNGTAPSASGGYDMTGYIPAKGGDVIVFSGDRSPGIPFMMGYTDKAGGGATVLLGNFDATDYGNLNVTSEEVTIPAGITFVRCSARNTSISGWASRNMMVIKRALTIEQKVVRIFTVGNSFSADVVESFLFDMAKEAGIKLIIGNACRGGYGVRMQWADIVNGTAETEYRKINSDRTYSITTGHTLYELLTDEPWDIITFQQHSQESGMYITYKPFLQNLIDYVKSNATNPNAKLGFIMTWPYAQNYESEGFGFYHNNQEIMFNAILDATAQAMQEHPDLTFLVPVGTAAQNLRSSFVGDHIDRDGSHLSFYIGRYLAAYTFYATIFGEEMAIQNEYLPYCLNGFMTQVTRKAALDAVRNPFSLTPQVYPDYVGENTIVPADININFCAWGDNVPQWNDLALYYDITAGLKDVNGDDSGIIVRYDNEFSSANSLGASVTQTPMDMPGDVSNTALYGYSEGDFYGQPHAPACTIRFQHLNKSLSYDFAFFSSRLGSTDNFEAKFLLNGADSCSAILDASNNADKIVTLSDVRPDENSTITLTVSAGPNNDNQYKFYYLNALRISAHCIDIPEMPETDFSKYEITHEFFTPDGVATSSSGGYDMTGYIPVRKGDVIVISGDRSPGIPFIMGYSDKEGNGATVLLGNFDQNDHNDLQVTEKEVTIPEGIVYVRCSARNTSLPGWAGRNMSVIRLICMDFALKGDDRPIIGDSLSISYSGDLSRYVLKWFRGNAFGVFDDASVLSTDKDYVITDKDYEHWVRATVCDQTGNAVFTKDTWISKLPVLYIDTDDGAPITSKTDYMTANLRIQGNADYELQYIGTTQIRGRGNSSWTNYLQKPYKLKLGKKTSLFSFGKSKHWVLISNYNDKSCLRNYIASELAKQLGVIGMNMTWVDVVLNGEVKGCYMLSQHIRVDKHSVDIFDWESEAEDIADALFNAIKDVDAMTETDKELLEEKMEQNLTWVTEGTVSFKGKTYNLSDYGLKKEYDITKGYMFEASQKKNGPTHFLTPQNVNFEVSAPEYLSTNNEMFSFVTNLWKDFEAEYCRVPTAEGKDFAKYADMESMVGIWLVNEIMGQNDLINSRFSYIANDGKIHFGPAWDYDHGSASLSATSRVNLFFTFRDKFTQEELRRSTYYPKWFPDPYLCQMLYDAYWDTARPFMMDVISEGGEMDSKYSLFAEAGETNDFVYDTYPYPQNPNAAPRTTAEDVEILRTFLLGHINWLDGKFQTLRTLAEAMNEVCTYPCDPKIIEDGVVNMEMNKQTDKARKVIRDKHLYIIKDDKTYSVDGKRIK